LLINVRFGGENRLAWLIFTAFAFEHGNSVIFNGMSPRRAYNGRLKETDLLLGVWREACRHLELEQSVGEIARLIGTQITADHLLIRHLDLIHAALDTVALAPCRPNVPALPATRSDLTDAAIQDLLAWCRDTEAVTGPAPGHPIVGLVSPSEFRGHGVAVPLQSDKGALGVVVLLSRRSAFKAADAALMARLREPIEAALANTARVRELKRLRESLEADKQALLSKLGRHDVADAVVGAETGLRAVMDRVEYVAGTDVPVLILGETGSGKEVLARALHERSPRARSPLVRVNCGVVPAGLVDSELLGHEHAAATGGVVVGQGWFERADGGTLFLDQISELPLDAQGTLSRILQGGAFERIGGKRPLSTDVRIIAATHRDLRDMVAHGTFREDLWHRISVFPIHLPPLRERREDIPGLAAQFAARAATRLVGVPLTPTLEDLDLLLAYDWPGNVRELAAVIERAAILGGGTTLRIAAALGPAAARAVSMPATAAVRQEAATAIETIDAAMRIHIEQALQVTRGRIEGPQGAARQLDINPQTLRARMRKLGITRAPFRRAERAPDRFDEPIVALDAAMADHIRRVLQATAGRIEGPHGAARRLEINPHTLRARMRKLGIVAGQFRAHRQARG
jgi:transcriptional regulator with GAF, ATPase, and Fis domain